MICERTFDMEKNTMPQTVPASGLSPPVCDYSAFAADCFDLSLLGADGEVPVSPPSLRHLIGLYGHPATPPDHEHFPTTILEHNLPQIKSPPPYHKPENVLTEQIIYQDSAALFEQFYIFGNQSPSYGTRSPSSDENSIPSINFQPSSPHNQHPSNYSTDVTTPLLCTIKEEPSNHLLSPHYSGGSPYPLSPSGSCASYASRPSPSYCSPQYTPQRIKDEAAIDIEELLKENQILQETIHRENGSDRLLEPKKEETGAKPRDYQLLREVLADTSFQERFNLRPLNIESLKAEAYSSSLLEVKMEIPDDNDALMTSCSTELAREKIEPVLSLAIEQMRRDVDNTCSTLGISPDPLQWSSEDVKAWVLWTLRQYSLPLVPVEYFAVDGASLVALTEDDFNQRTPQAGSTLYAQLEIWKAARQEQWVAEAGPAAWSEPPPSTSAPSVASSSGDVTDDEEETPSAVGAKAPSPKQGSSHIHLWQFLKELLASPQIHGSAIRWLDRSKGVFKIEDSVRVARLWGKRKNRPAMNYDKLSRSIRQYYKKGIMKKTERSQRLVYQFCHPYCL